MRIKSRTAYLETLVPAIPAGALVAAGAGSWHLELADWIHFLKPWARNGEVFRLVITLYGLAFAAATAASFLSIRYRAASLSVLCARRARAVAAEVRATWDWLYQRAALEKTLLWVLAMTVVGTAVRCYFLAQPMRYDEAYTFNNFVDRGLTGLFYYPLPNNHVLYTLLARVSVEMFGGHPAAIRLPALMASLCTVPLTFWVSRLVTRDRSGGYLAGALAAVFPFLVLYGTMARGHSLLILLTLGLAVLAFRLTERPSPELCFLIALTVSAGLLVMPSFALAAVGILSWALVTLVWNGHRPAAVAKRVLMPCGVLTVLLTAWFYTPTILVSKRAVLAVVDNPAVHGAPWQSFLGRLPQHAAETASRFSRDVPDWMLAAAVLLAIAGGLSLARQDRRKALLLFPAVAIGGAAVVLAKHVVPLPRVWIFILPWVFILVDAGLTAVARSVAGTVRTAVLVLACGSGWLLVTHDVIASYSDTGRFPEAPVVVDVLAKEMLPGDQVVAGVPASATVRFYMKYRNVPRSDRQPGDPRAAKIFFVVVPRLYTLSDATDLDARKVFEVGQAVLYVAETTADSAPFETKSRRSIRLLN
jgi:hypothetical protein